MKQVISGFIISIIIISSVNIKSSQSHNRTAKFWQVGIVRFQNDICQSLEGRNGTCYRRQQCLDNGGINSGRCANNFGACCVFQETCGGLATFNNTYFTNPGYPGTVTVGTTCSITIRKCSSEICQVRLDFLNLILAQPDGNGNCITDSLVVTGGASNIPIICGENNGQHIYVNFNGDNDIIIQISTLTSNTPRSWNIKITQLACDCPSLAPTGCLMYYTEVSGTVTSFNYGTTISGALITRPDGMVRPGTRELANLNYGVCVQMQAGFCSIQWSQGPDPTSFTVSGNTAAQAVPPPGLPNTPMSGTDCPNDFVVVPNPMQAGAALAADRFCGNQFVTVTSSSKPFVLTVVTNQDEITNLPPTMSDVANRGFVLNYAQLPCTGALTNNLLVGLG